MNLTPGRLKLFLLIASAPIFISSANNDANEKDNIRTTATADGIYPQARLAEANDTPHPRILAKSKKKHKHKSSKRGKNHKAKKQKRSDNGDGYGGIFGSVATTSCSATVNQSKVGFNASRQFMNKLPKPIWQKLGQQYSTCSANTLTSLKFFDIPGWSGDLSMSDMDAILTANPNVKTVIVAVPQNKLGTTFKSTEAVLVVDTMNTLNKEHTGIKFILAVGNEPFGNGLKDVHDAMVLLYTAMTAMSTVIPMSTPLSATVFQNSWPPGDDFFTDQATMKQILNIVFQSNGPFMVNRYPYFDILGNQDIELNCALGVNCFAQFVSQFEIDILASRFAVTNLYNGVGEEYLYFSNKDNFYVTETGWPSCGTYGSNTNLITYNKNAIRDVETGALQDVVGKVFLFEAHDEENKGGGAEEGCFGLMDENGTPKN